MGPHRRGRRPGRRGRAFEPDDPRAREHARDTLHRALDRGEDPERAARGALAVCGECAEAWLLLADTAVSLAEARDRVRKAVEVATRALGEAGLREGRGRLGETADGASYLHALAALARVQIAEDRAAQAIQTLQGLLAMDPEDPVPVRGDLLLLLLATGRDDEAEDLVAAYAEEASADWMLGRALLRRRRAADAAGLARATAALDRAVARFPAAARALLEPSGPSGREPAADPVLRQAWEDTEGALDWLRARLDAAPTATPSPRPAAADREADRRFTAREHVEEAREAQGERREALARAALEAWPDCAEAWRLLGGSASDPRERVARLREAVAAARRALGLAADAPPAPLPDSDDARADLRARFDLAAALRAAGDEEGALAEERTLLAEDPDDPLGAGVPHIARLLRLGRDEEAGPVLEAHAEDASPGWAWARVLAARRAGDRVATAFALGEATLVAPLVAPMLLAGAGGVPRSQDQSADAYEAARRAAEALRAAWEATSGALAWLRERCPPPADASRGRPAGGRTP